MERQQCEQQLHLFLLCDDVILEILKYLGKKDMGNLSLTCKQGYDLTKFFFEKQTQLKFLKPLSFQDLRALTNSTRNYEEVTVFVLDKRNEIILDQLNHAKIDPTSVHLTTDRYSDISDQISKLKAKYKTIKKVLVDPGNSLRITSVNDIQSLKDRNICPKDVTSLELSLDPNEPFDESFFQTFVAEFSGLKELEVSHNGIDNLIINLPDEDYTNSFNIKTVRFHSEISEQVSFLRLFRGITTLRIDDCADSFFLKALLDLNENTLQNLELGLYRPSEYNLVLPSKLKSLKVFAECEHFVDHLLDNQNGLEHMELNIALTPEFLEKMGSRCGPHLDIRKCDYNSYIDVAAEIRKSIPELPMVRNFEVNHLDLPYYLPKTKNIETLKVVTSYFEREAEEESKGFECLDGLELENLTTLNLEDLDDSLYNGFFSITLNMPKLEMFKGHFHSKLLEKYPQIRFLEVRYCCNYDNVSDILSKMSNVEELKVFIEVEHLTKVLNYLEFSDFGKQLKYVAVSARVNSADRFEILRKLERKGNRIFSNYKDGEEVYIVDVTVEIDMLDREFMYSFVKV